MKSQIGSKNKDYYIVQWGPPSKKSAATEELYEMVKRVATKDQ